ncbi:sarcosine oxidase subunit gamma [Plasticicumulans acidivorans]|uniref:Heterotetrameric sarcosine oxidase gamma subunit n=1 Tax=Plasticicumulans acidivorans TaxID=886464 RepID=A0A317N0Q4_9GAMM|nr:sarcosine oxidase subunit gamma family protein [Plasticicumulans acidivorans]PWV64916.1 heterotetrameric sarcosine oxidase gamma subunit [Plasticicumulans acidivorans]
MSEAVRLQSPLVGFQLDARADAGVILRERAFCSHLNLRGEQSDPAFAAAIKQVLGLEVPFTPNTTTSAGDQTLYWLGPDEWLLVAAPEQAATLEAALRKALAGQFASVVDISGGQTVVELRGGNARDVLAKGCPLDLHPRAFGVGQCAQSHLAKCPLLLRPLADGFEVVVRRSFSDYFFSWIEDAAQEYGFSVVS